MKWIFPMVETPSLIETQDILVYYDILLSYGLNWTSQRGLLHATSGASTI